MSIFLSYRRASQTDFVRDLWQALQAELQGMGLPSWQDVFRDEDSIRPGEDFAARLQAEASTCDLFVAFVDDLYLGERFDREDDMVRAELRHALEVRRRIVPVLRPGAQWPPSRALPTWAAGLERCQALDGNLEAATLARRLAQEYRHTEPVNRTAMQGELVDLAAVQLVGEEGDLVPGVVSIGAEGDVRWIRLADGSDYRPPLALDLEGRRVSAVAVAGYGNSLRIVLGLTDSSIAVCDLNDGEVIWTPRLEMPWQHDPQHGPLVANGAYCTSVNYVAQGAEYLLVYANTAGQISLWPELTSRSGLPVWIVRGIRAFNFDALVVVRREYLPRTGIGDFVEIREVETGRLRASIQADVSALITARVQGEVRILSGGRDGTVSAWDSSLQRLAYRAEGTAGITAIAEVAGVVVVGRSDGTVQPFAAQDLRPLGQPRSKHAKAVVALATTTTRNRRFVVSGGAEGSLRAYVVESLIQAR